jgi:hypothetical protein
MESSLTLDLLGLVAVVILVLLNGFFVAAEFSLVSVRQTRIAELVEKGHTSAEAVSLQPSWASLWQASVWGGSENRLSLILSNR